MSIILLTDPCVCSELYCPHPAPLVLIIRRGPRAGRWKLRGLSRWFGEWWYSREDCSWCAGGL